MSVYIAKIICMIDFTALFKAQIVLQNPVNSGEVMIVHVKKVGYTGLIVSGSRIVVDFKI
jgi:hypothetical protein